MTIGSGTPAWGGGDFETGFALSPSVMGGVGVGTISGVGD